MQLETFRGIDLYPSIYRVTDSTIQFRRFRSFKTIGFNACARADHLPAKSDAVQDMLEIRARAGLSKKARVPSFMRIGQIGLDVLRKLNGSINADSLRCTRAKKDQEPA